MYTTGDKQLIRKINESSILKVIQQKGVVSRAEIAKILGLTPATITNNINSLLAQGLVIEVGSGHSCGGRKPILLKLNESGVFFIGVSIHRNSIRAAVVNLAGEIVLSEERVLISADLLEEEVLACIRRVRERFGDRGKLYGIGIGAPGIVDMRRDIITYMPANGRRNVPLKALVEEAEGLSVCMDNDSNAMAIGEWYFGCAKGVGDYVFLNVGWGIGAGVAMGGEIYRGNAFASGEIGHIRIQDNGCRCVCGKYGCLSTVASQHSILQEVSRMVQAGCPSIVQELEPGGLENLSIETLEKAAELQDKCVMDVLENVGRNLGIAASYVVEIINPKLIILGGGTVSLSKYMLKPLVQSVTALAMEESMKDTQIVVSALGKQAGVVGAASLCVHNLLQKW